MSKKPGEFVTPRYNDLIVRIIATILASYIVTEYGGNEPLLQELVTYEFYIEFGATLLITALIIQIIYWVTLYLDRHFDWHQTPVVRTLLQFLLGVATPTLITFLLATLYFRIYNINILDTNYHLYALPFIVALISIGNIYYYIRYLLAERTHPGGRLNHEDQDATPASGEQSNERENRKQVFVVHTPIKSYPVPVTSIAYFFREKDHVFLRPHTGNDAILSQSLEQIELQLDSAQFFRAARHLLVSYDAIESYHSLDYGKLGLILKPAYKEPVTVSKLLARSFRQWMDR